MVESSGTPMMRAEGDTELTELLIAHGGKVERNEEREAIQKLIKQRRFAEAERRYRGDRTSSTSTAIDTETRASSRGRRPPANTM
jgi:hypothetical protein